MASTVSLAARALALVAVARLRVSKASAVVAAAATNVPTLPMAIQVVELSASGASNYGRWI